MGTEAVSFFPDETAFLDTVFGKDGENWKYFVRVLVNKFPFLVECRRATGPTAPLYIGWRSHLDTDTSYRRYEVLIGSCDAEDIIMDAIERCMRNPSLASFYRQYTPLKSAFTTWFINHLRSCAGVRIRQWTCRKRQARRLDTVRRFDQRTPACRQEVDTLICPQRPAFMEEPDNYEISIEAAAEESKVPEIIGETVAAFLARGGSVRCVPDCPAGNFPPDLAAARDEKRAQRLRSQQAHTTRAERKEPWYSPDYSTLEDRHDLKTLAAACLTDEEQHILSVRLTCTYADVAFAQEIGYHYDKARSKTSYIIKKIKKYVQ